MLTYFATADEIQASGCDIAILPVGSTEQHGPHLPVCTDTLLAERISEEVARQLGAFLLPALPISNCLEHRGIKGSVWVTAGTLSLVFRDIVQSLKVQGFQKVILALCHGGIFIGNQVVREINAENQERGDSFRVIKMDYSDPMGAPEVEALMESKNGLHACEMETSLMLYLHPDWVHMDRAVDFSPDVPREYLNYFPLRKLSKPGVWGKPTLATREKGEKMFRIIADKSVENIRRLLALLESDLPSL